MYDFLDSKQRSWEVALDAFVIMKIRGDCDPKFLLGDGDGAENTWFRLEEDPVLLCRVIFIICGAQRHERNVTEEEFYKTIIGNSIDEATTALHKALLTFIPRRTREMLESSAGRRERLRQIGTDRILKRVNDPELENKIIAKMEQEIDEALDRLIPSASAIVTPASSASLRAG